MAKAKKTQRCDVETAPGSTAPESDAPAGKFDVPYSRAYFEDKNYMPHGKYFTPIDGDEPTEN